MAQHIFDRVDVSKENRSLRTSQNRYKWTDLRKRYISEFEKHKIKLNIKNLSDKDIKLINEKIRKKIINERIMRNIYVSLITLLISIVLIYLISLL